MYKIRKEIPQKPRFKGSKVGQRSKQKTFRCAILFFFGWCGTQNKIVENCEYCVVIFSHQSVPVRAKEQEKGSAQGGLERDATT